MSIWLDIPQAEISTIAVYVTALSCLLLVIRLSLPLNALRTAMLLVSTAGLTIAFIFFGGLFNLVFLSTSAIITLCVMSACTFLLFNLFYNIADKIIE